MEKTYPQVQTRRSFLAMIAAGAACGGLSRFSQAIESGKKMPNIVIMYADDMGYGDLGILNPDSKIPTPHLDTLAREGMRFTDAHSSSGICSPSRYALLTGTYHWRKFHDIVHSFGQPVFDGELTLPEMLRRQGYQTACIGKWHLGWDWNAIRVGPPTVEKIGAKPEDYDWSKPIPGGPTARGFDYYFGDDVPNFPPYTWIENDRILAMPTEKNIADPVPEEGAPEGRPGPMAPGWKLDAVMPRLTEKAVAWIAAQKESAKPFFLYFPWTSPHTPIVPTSEFKGKSGAGPFGDYVHQSDWSAGQVLKALEDNGFRDNTLVIFASDNGPESYAYPRIQKYGHRSMGPLRGLKRDIYEGGHRTPLVMRWPGVIPEDSVCDSLIGQVDLMATIAALTEFALPDDAARDSFDLTPLLRGQSPQPPLRTEHVHNTSADHYAFRQGDWVLIDAPTGAISKVPDWYNQECGYPPDGRPQALYNLREDIGQRKNRIDEFPDKATAMKQALEHLRQHGQRSS